MGDAVPAEAATNLRAARETWWDTFSCQPPAADEQTSKPAKQKPSPRFGARALTRSRGSTRFAAGPLWDCRGISFGPITGPSVSLTCRSKVLALRRSGPCSRGVFNGVSRRRLSTCDLLSLSGSCRLLVPVNALCVLEWRYYMPLLGIVKKTFGGIENHQSLFFFPFQVCQRLHLPLQGAPAQT